jgi:hypothetical protein
MIYAGCYHPAPVADGLIKIPHWPHFGREARNMSGTDYKTLYEQTERGYRTLAEQLVERDKAEL